MMKLPKTAFAGWRVLLVEDEPDNLEVATRVLRYYSAEIMTANNGKEALEVLQTFMPDFIVSDLSMPVMDGWGLCYEVKNNPKLSHLPIFALTAHAMVGDRERALSAGFDNYLTKPIAPATFVQQLLDILKNLSVFAERMQDVEGKV